MNPDRKKNWIGRILLLVFSLLLACLTGEVLIRAWLQATQGAARGGWQAFARGDVAPRSSHALAAITRVSRNPAVIYELRPNLSTRFGGCRLVTNSLGARAEREYARERDHAVLRIVGVGDSGMFGWDVDQGGDYLSVLERNLDARTDCAGCEVINLAVPGYNTRQELERLKETGLPLKPDIVILGWCANDFGLPFFLNRPRNHWRTRACYVERLLFNRLAFVELLEPDVVKGREPGMPAGEVPAGDRGEEAMRKTLTELRALACSRGFHVLMFGPMRKDITSLCREAGIDYVNTLEAIPSDRYPKSFRLTDMHPRPEGHRALAKELEKALEVRAWLGKK